MRSGRAGCKCGASCAVAGWGGGGGAPYPAACAYVQSSCACGRGVGDQTRWLDVSGAAGTNSGRAHRNLHSPKCAQSQRGVGCSRHPWWGSAGASWLGGAVLLRHGPNHHCSHNRGAVRNPHRLLLAAVPQVAVRGALLEAGASLDDVDAGRPVSTLSSVARM